MGLFGPILDTSREATGGKKVANNVVDRGISHNLNKLVKDKCGNSTDESWLIVWVFVRVGGDGWVGEEMLEVFSEKNFESFFEKSVESFSEHFFASFSEVEVDG